MMTTKLIADGGSQAIRLPESCRFDCDELCVNRIGNAVVLTPKSGDMPSPMMAAAELFADDFMEGVEDLRLQEVTR